MKKTGTKKIMTWIGRVLMAGSLVFIVWKVTRYDIDFTLLASPLIIAGLVLASLLYGASILYSAFVFSWLLSVLAKVKVNRRRINTIFCGSNLYKYLPGNFMHFVGRNRIATETAGISHAVVAAATVIDSATLCIAAVIISTVCVFNYTIAYLQQTKISPFLFIGVGSVLLIVIMLGVIFRRRLAKIIYKAKVILQEFRLASAVKMFLSCCVRLLTLSLTYFAVLALLGQSVSFDMIPQIIGLFVLSWVVGFVMPGAPGGLGVREIIMITFLGDTLSQNILLSSTIIHRVVCILGDILAYVMAVLYSKTGNDRE